MYILYIVSNKPEQDLKAIDTHCVCSPGAIPLLQNPKSKGVSYNEGFNLLLSGLLLTYTLSSPQNNGCMCSTHILSSPPDLLSPGILMASVLLCLSTSNIWLCCNISCNHLEFPPCLLHFLGNRNRLDSLQLFI